MEPQKVIILQLIFLGVTFKSSMADSYYELKSFCAWEPVSSEICRKEYNKTIFPNKVNKFSTQEDALQEFMSFNVEALKQECFSIATKLLCSYYFPPCLTDLDCQGIGPCDTLCEQVQSVCESMLLENNYTWPDRLNCSRFPTSKSADPYCIPGTSTPPTAITIEPTCEKVKQPVCASLHPNYMTKFPNKEFITQYEADMRFNTISSAVASKCSSMLKELLCTVHYPVCINGSFQIYPCRSMCREVKRKCEPILLQEKNISWPEFLNCSNFPTKNKGICADSFFTAPLPELMATVPTVTNLDKCEPILPEVLEICGGIHPNYTMTHFPYGQFATQKEAIEELQNSTLYLAYFKLLDQNCAAELKPFLCLNFFPMCSPKEPHVIVKPCRNICRKARTKCEACLDEKFKWNFNCNDYHVKGTCLNLDKLDSYLRKFSKESKC